MYIIVKLKRGYAVQNARTNSIVFTCKTESEANAVFVRLNQFKAA